MFTLKKKKRAGRKPAAIGLSRFLAIAKAKTTTSLPTSNDKTSVAIVLMSYIELYNLIKDFQVVKRNCVLPIETLDELFDSMFSYLFQSGCKIALKILKLRSLLLPKHVQAETSKFFFLTVNKIFAPRLDESVRLLQLDFFAYETIG